MSPAVADKETTEERTWTLREVEKQEETLSELRTKLAGLAEQEHDLQGAVANALADGEDAAELKEDLRGVRDLRRDLEATEPVLEQRIEQRRHLALQEMAKQRLQTLVKKAGGIVGEYSHKVDRLEEARQRFLDLAGAVRGTPYHLKMLRLEARALAERFDLPEPDLRRIPEEERSRADGVSGMARPGDVGRESISLSISSNLRSGDYLTAVQNIADSLETLFGEQTPTPEILAALHSTEDAG